MHIYITRHGETEWNKLQKTQGIQDTKLTDRGRKQAESLGKRLKNKSIRYLYSSDLDRAFETASIIGSEIELAPIPSPLLKEVSFGAWEGLSIEEIEKQYPGSLHAWYQNINFAAPEGGESISSVQKRISFFIEEIKKIHSVHDEKLLIVSHALTCKVLILELLDMPLQYINKIKLDNASLSLVEVSDKRNRVLLLNDGCHINE